MTGSVLFTPVIRADTETVSFPPAKGWNILLGPLAPGIRATAVVAGMLQVYSMSVPV